MAFRERRLRPPARSLGVLHPRRGVPDPGARGEGGAARDARRDADRPRLAGGRDRPLQSRAGAGREAHHRLRGLRRRRPGQAAQGPCAPDAARRIEGRLRQPDQALLARLPRGLLLSPACRLGVARAVRAGHDRPLGLPVRPGLEGDRRVAAERRRAGARSARADLRPRQHLRRVAERRPRHPATGLPGATRACGQAGLAARRHR